jgi:hypothetical protein
MVVACLKVLSQNIPEQNKEKNLLGQSLAQD